MLIWLLHAGISERLCFIAVIHFHMLLNSSRPVPGPVRDIALLN